MKEVSRAENIAAFLRAAVPIKGAGDFVHAACDELLHLDAEVRRLQLIIALQDKSVEDLVASSQAANQRAERAEAVVRAAHDLCLARDWDMSPPDADVEKLVDAVTAALVAKVAVAKMECAVCGDDGSNSWKCLHCPKTEGA